MIMELLAHKDYVRILQAIRRKPRRFGELQKELGLNPTQVDRAVKFLRKGLWIVPRVAPSETGRMLVEYELGKRGGAFLESFKAFRVDALRRKAALGPSVVAELRRLAG
jgi:DNA-binding HxlR family transcriptional regulator